MEWLYLSDQDFAAYYEKRRTVMEQIRKLDEEKRTERIQELLSKLSDRTSNEHYLLRDVPGRWFVDTL